MAQLECGGCHCLLMYTRGATSVQCSQCFTVNLVMQPNQMAHINCQGCGVTLACVPCLSHHQRLLLFFLGGRLRTSAWPLHCSRSGGPIPHCQGGWGE
jgi:LSD1 subclass zinc finger protein